MNTKSKAHHFKNNKRTTEKQQIKITKIQLKKTVTFIFIEKKMKNKKNFDFSHQMFEFRNIYNYELLLNY